MSDALTVGGHRVEVSHRDKVLFPRSGLTKGDLVDYYLRIAEVMLPHLRGRPISMQRFPDGIDGEGFYQKEVPGYFPDWIERAEVVVGTTGARQSQVIVDQAATLVYLANQACITPHTWLSRVGHLDHPDKLIFDLDPPGDDFEAVRGAALALHDLLDEIDLPSTVMTTGSRGVHVVVPLVADAPFDDVRGFAREIADLLAARGPETWTTEPRKEKRRGRLFLDTMRNAYGQTSVPPYAVRAHEEAPVATPLDWDELRDPAMHSRRYTIANIFRRLGQKPDPWGGAASRPVALSRARASLSAFSRRRGRR